MKKLRDVEILACDRDLSVEPNDLPTFARERRAIILSSRCGGACNEGKAGDMWHLLAQVAWLLAGSMADQPSEKKAGPVNVLRIRVGCVRLNCIERYVSAAGTVTYPPGNGTALLL